MNIQRINNWFERQTKKIIQHRWVFLGAFFLILLLGINGLKYLNISTSFDDYFMEDDPVLVKTDEFKAIFGNDNYAAVLTNCENTFTHKNLSLIRELSNEMLDSIPFSDKITSITDIEFLTGTEDGMHIEQIVPEIIPSDKIGLEKIKEKAYSKPRTAERLVSKDGKLTWILLKLLPFPEDNEAERYTHKGPSSEQRVGVALKRIISKKKYQSIHPRGAGMPFVSNEKMTWVGKEMGKTMGIAILSAILILLLVTKSLRGVIVPILTSISSIVMVYGLLGYLDYKIDSGMMIVPMLVAFAVAIAYNIHVYSYFKREFHLRGNRKQAIIAAMKEMGWPILFSALTTVSALISFLVIKVVPLHFVGIATASCVLLTFFIVVIIMPICLSFGKNKKIQEGHKGSTEHASWIDAGLSKFSAHVLKYGKAIIVVSILLALFLLVGITRISTAFDIEKTMGRKVPYVNDLLNVSQSELGSLYAYDLLINFENNDEAKNPINLKKLEQLEAHVKQYPLTKRTTSILNILKDLNQTLHENREKFYTIPKNQNQVAQLLLLYENAGGTESEYWIDYDYKRLRLMVELENYNSVQAKKELTDITRFSKTLFPNAKVTTVGSLPQFTSMMQYVVHGQIASFGISLLIITFLLIIVFGKVRIGLIGIIPNIAPAFVVGGIMGWMGIPLDMMAATIMPMILGLAVDDTIHFINHTHLEYDRKKNYKQAIQRSFFIVGAPLILTTIIISANFSVYLTSDATGFFNMGVLSVAGMLAALLSDLLLTPVLIEKFRIYTNHNKK